MGKKLNGILTAGIINVIDALLSVAIFVSSYLLLKSGVISEGLEGGQALGFAFVVVIFLPIALICYIPLGIHALYKIAFAIVSFVSFGKAKKGNKISVCKGCFTANLVLRIFTLIFLTIEGILLYAIFDAGNATVYGIVFVAGLVILLGLQITEFVLESIAKKQKINYVDMLEFETDND